MERSPLLAFARFPSGRIDHARQETGVGAHEHRIIRCRPKDGDDIGVGVPGHQAEAP